MRQIGALILALALAACSEEPTPRTPEGEISDALDRQRPDMELQQVHRIEINGLPAFCGTAGKKVKKVIGGDDTPVEPFLYRDGAFQWAGTDPAASSEFSTRCAGLIAPDRGMR